MKLKGPICKKYYEIEDVGDLSENSDDYERMCKNCKALVDCNMVF